jgi:hypothetical protein
LRTVKVDYNALNTGWQGGGGKNLQFSYTFIAILPNWKDSGNFGMTGGASPTCHPKIAVFSEN